MFLHCIFDLHQDHLGHLIGFIDFDIKDNSYDIAEGLSGLQNKFRVDPVIRNILREQGMKPNGFFRRIIRNIHFSRCVGAPSPRLLQCRTGRCCPGINHFAHIGGRHHQLADRFPIEPSPHFQLVYAAGIEFQRQFRHAKGRDGHLRRYPENRTSFRGHHAGFRLFRKIPNLKRQGCLVFLDVHTVLGDIQFKII